VKVKACITIYTPMQRNRTEVLKLWK